VAALVAEVGKAHARLAALDEFCYRLSSDDMHIAWRALDYPGLVERAAARTEEALELDKVHSIAVIVLHNTYYDRNIPLKVRVVLHITIVMHCC
jgi:hypothetical protein